MGFSVSDLNPVTAVNERIISSKPGQKIINKASDILFGESPSVDKSQQSLTTPEQQAALTELITQLQAQTQQGPVGGTTQQQQDLLNTIIGRAGQSPVVQQATSPLYDSAEAALTSILSGEGGRTPAEFDEFFRTTVQDPLVESFREDVIPGAGIKFGTNLFSSDREKFLGEQFENLTTQLARERSRLAYEDRNRATQDVLSAAGIAPSVQGVQQEQQNQLFQQALAGDAQAFDELLAAYGIAGTERDALVQDEQLRQNLLQLLLGASTGQTVENLAVVNPGSQGLVSSFLEGGGGAALGQKLVGM